MLDRIADLTWHHPRKILAAALLFVAVAGFFGHDVEHHLKAAGFTDPSSESERAGDVLSEALGYSAQPGLVVLLRDRDGGPLEVTDPTIKAEVDRLAAELRGAAYVGNVTSVPAEDGRSVALLAQLSTNDLEDKGGLADESVRERVRSDVLEVGYGGYAPSFNEVNDQTRKDLTNAELIAFPLLAILLLLVFRGAVAAAVPLIIGALSIVGTLLALRIMATFTGTSVFALNIGTALSLGLAVDYALLIVSRHREETAVAGFTLDAHRRMVRTAGRTALFSGLTVAGAMAALCVMPQRFLYSVGAAGAVVGVLSAVMALLVAPALLVVLGPRINALSIRRGPGVSDTSNRWLRVAQGVMKRPVLVAVGTTVLMLALAAPLLGTHLTGPSAQAVPPGQQSYGVNKYLESHYGREVVEGVSLTVDGTTDPDVLEDLRSRIMAVPGVDRVAPFTAAGGDVAFATASFEAPALSDESQNALKAVRALDDPDGGRLLVAGNTASFVDEKTSLVENAPRAIGLIVLLTVVLLFLLTGSVLLPLKTLLMNTMTLAASLGILVIVFEKKFLVGLLDYPGPYSVEVTSLVFLFAVAFALATDYAVLVMARVKELRDGGMGDTDAVAHGVARTGRIISAAAIMIAVVFAAFAVSPVFFMKQIAVGMALGVVIDATIVRALLVPSLMRLLGEANWWAPGPLRRLHDRFGMRH
ncbi:MMPL family transporter [Nocardioides marmoriginsengisoli]|uniref:MMPL family transporter n=1 Tax=Nocardioides marmoriginsengisoli TaxID=661483 RepID=A0A3N0CCR2_9ACTN|nr:MMPL family transporter [Nocardioides marmoriginsengisoli]RNL61099.1 MMPL family transporter [Nocardioides marmoriginsengisoli]